MARLLVIGGSLGGLMAANLLVRAGHDVTVLERSGSSLEGRGAGIVSHDALVRGLARCGMNPGTKLGVEVQDRRVLGPDGTIEAETRMPQTLTSWSRLYQILRECLQEAAPQAMRFGVTVRSIQSEDGRVVTTSGEVLEADLVIAADGIRSTVRAQLWPQVTPEYAGYVAWRGLCEETWLSQGCRRAIFDCFGFGLPAGEQLIGYPVAGADHRTESPHRAWNFVWYRPAPDLGVDARGTLQDLLTDADGVRHEHGIAPQAVSWRHIADVRQQARQLLAPAFAEIIEKTPQPFLQPIYDVCSSALVQGRVALLGDAAFVARPHIGMGVTKAMDDACALTDAVTEHGATPRALESYERLRLPAGRHAVERARWLGAYMQASARGQGNSAPRSADSVMRETALDLERYPTAFRGLPGAPGQASHPHDLLTHSTGTRPAPSGLPHSAHH